MVNFAPSKYFLNFSRNTLTDISRLVVQYSLASTQAFAPILDDTPLSSLLL